MCYCRSVEERLNWVERRARREQNLSQAVEAWESVRTAIGNCCESFNEIYSDIGEIRYKTENGHRVRVQITFNTPQRLTRNVSFEFSKTDKEITCTVDGGAAKKFNIVADETHAFLQHPPTKEEISPDRLTEIALENAFFKLPAAPGPAPRRIRNFHQAQSDLE